MGINCSRDNSVVPQTEYNSDVVEAAGSVEEHTVDGYTVAAAVEETVNLAEYTDALAEYTKHVVKESGAQSSEQIDFEEYLHQLMSTNGQFDETKIENRQTVLAFCQLEKFYELNSTESASFSPTFRDISYCLMLDAALCNIYSGHTIALYNEARARFLETRFFTLKDEAHIHPIFKSTRSSMDEESEQEPTPEFTNVVAPEAFPQYQDMYETIASFGPTSTDNQTTDSLPLMGDTPIYYSNLN